MIFLKELKMYLREFAIVDDTEVLGAPKEYQRLRQLDNSNNNRMDCIRFLSINILLFYGYFYFLSPNWILMLDIFDVRCIEDLSVIHHYLICSDFCLKLSLDLYYIFFFVSIFIDMRQNVYTWYEILINPFDNIEKREKSPLVTMTLAMHTYVCCP